MLHTNFMRSAPGPRSYGYRFVTMSTACHTIGSKVRRELRQVSHRDGAAAIGPFEGDPVVRRSSLK